MTRPNPAAGPVWQSTIATASGDPAVGSIVSASWDGTVRLWDAATGEVLQTLKGYPSWVYVVNSVTFSPDGKQLALASDDRTVRLWDATTGAIKFFPKNCRNWVKLFCR